MRVGIAILSLCLSGVAVAQTGPSYQLSECTLNAGDHPQGGATLQSAGFVMSLDAIGDGGAAPVMRSNAYSMDIGFGRSYPPPAEVLGIVALPDKETFAWQPDGSVGAYEVYRGEFDVMPGFHGTCRFADVPLQTVTLDDLPDSGQGFFYLVTSKSRLHEEGSEGTDSSGTERANPVPCP